jgi:stringent starvation protein B
VNETEQKRHLVESLLQRGEVLVVVDCQVPHVVVPVEHAKARGLILKFSHRYDRPEIHVDDFGLAATLSFGGRRFRVDLPWGSIGRVFSREFDVTFAEPGTETTNPAAAPDPRPVLGVVDGGRAAAEPASPPRCGHLHLVA